MMALARSKKVRKAAVGDAGDAAKAGGAQSRPSPSATTSPRDRAEQIIARPEKKVSEKTIAALAATWSQRIVPPGQCRVVWWNSPIVMFVVEQNGLVGLPYSPPCSGLPYSPEPPLPVAALSADFVEPVWALSMSLLPYSGLAEPVLTGWDLSRIFELGLVELWFPK
jgi:hypothetical protein